MTTFQNELRSLARHSCALTNAQAAITWYDDDLLRFKVKLKPNSGLYQGCLYEFTIRASDNYPISPPIIISCSYILHPNINEYGEVYHRDLNNWSRTYNLTFVVECLLELFHRPNFTYITNDEIRDLTDVEFIRTVSAWKRTQVQVEEPPQILGSQPRHPDPQSFIGAHPTSQQFVFTDPLGSYGSCTSLLSVAGHLDENCQCNNEYIVVTNSRRPRPSSARQARAFERSEQRRQQWTQNVQFHSPSLLDLSDVYDSLNNAEPDYEIRSVSSDEDVRPLTETLSTPNIMSPRTTTPNTSRSGSYTTTPNTPRSTTGLSGSSSSYNHHIGYLSNNSSSSSSRNPSRPSSVRPAPEPLIIDGIRSRLSSRLQSRENTWNSHVGHSLLTDSPSLNRNRNNHPKPDFNKDINMNNFL